MWKAGYLFGGLNDYVLYSLRGCSQHLLTRVTLRLCIFNPISLHRGGFTMRGFAWATLRAWKVKLAVSDLYFNAGGGGRQSICTVQSSLGQPLLWITPSNLWEMHSFSRARSRTFLPLCWMLCVYDPQTERLPRLLQIKKTAGILHSRAPSVHLAAEKARFEQSEWPERTPRVMLSTVKQLSRRIAEAFSCNSIWVVALEGLKRAPSPHLLPLIRWIKPPPTYTFPPRHSSPWPQLPTKPCRWNTLITDHQPTTSTLIGWRGGGAEWLPIRVRFRFHKNALSASVWDFPLKTKLLSTSHGGLKKQHSSFLKLMVMTGNVTYIDWWANYVRSTPSYFSQTTEKQTGRTKSPATEFSAQSQG